MASGTRRAGQHRIAAITLFLCAVPYLGLRLYVSAVMHDGALLATQPSSWLLGVLLFVGAVLPGVGVALILRRLLKDRLQFHLLSLLEAYAAVILIFASGYAVLQSSGVESNFLGMPLLWSSDGLSIEAHVDQLHDIFFESVYLSTVTITTVGYGDLAPLSKLAKILTAVEGMAGIAFMGIALGHYFSVCLHRRS